MNGDVLLDTNPVVALFASQEAIIRRLDHSGTVFVPCVVLAELYYGANKSGRVSENLARAGGTGRSRPVLRFTIRT